MQAGLGNGRDTQTPPWGVYAPPESARLLRLLIRARLGRGFLRKAVLRRWERRFGPWVEIAGGGIRYRLNISDNTTDRKILACPHRLDRIEIAALAGHVRNGVFVDIGANTGHYALVLAKAGPASVVAIEPNPPALQRLSFHVALNGLETKIDVVPAAVGPSGSLPLFAAPGDLGGASLLRRTDRVMRGCVPVHPLAEILQTLRVPAIAGLKIDIEGMEDRALIPFFNEASRSLWPVCLVVEHAHRTCWRTDAIAFLLSRGYRVRNMTRENAVLELA